MTETAHPRRATVRYRVAVYATVDLDAGTVDEVTKDGDSIRQDGRGPAAIAEPAWER